MCVWDAAGQTSDTPRLRSPTTLLYCSTVSAMSFFLAHSGQMMSSPSVMNPLPTMLALQLEQMKQSLCQCLPSKLMKRVPPIPDTGWPLVSPEGGGGGERTRVSVSVCVCVCVVCLFSLGQKETESIRAGHLGLFYIFFCRMKMLFLFHFLFSERDFLGRLFHRPGPKVFRLFF